MFHGLLDYFQKPPLGGRPNTKPRDHDTLNAHNRWFILFYHVWEPVWIESIKTTFGWGPGHIWLHTTLEHPWPHYMTSEVCWDDVWTLPFGLSQTSQSRLLAHVWSGPKLVIDSLSPSIQWIEEKVGGGRFILFYHVRARMNRNSSKRHSTEGPGHIWLHTTLEDPWPRYMISEVCWEGISTLPFGLSQLHGRGSWLVHEVALS